MEYCHNNHSTTHVNFNNWNVIQDLSSVMTKPIRWFPTRFNIDQAVQAQKMVRDWKCKGIVLSV